MYKPYTIEQYKIHQFMKEEFELSHFLLSPLSRSALMLEDKTGAQIAFAYQGKEVREIPIPQPAPPEEVRLFIKEFRALSPKPRLTDFEAVTKWWLNHLNPLTYQQALGLPDKLYRHFLACPLLSDEKVVSLARKGLVTRAEYQDILLWYFNGHVASCWLGPVAVDGTGELYSLILDYGKPNRHEISFYLDDDYYRFMNRARR